MLQFIDGTATYFPAGRKRQSHSHHTKIGKMNTPLKVKKIKLFTHESHFAQ